MGEIRVKSENILDDENYAGEGYLSPTGIIVPQLNYVVSKLIPVTSGVRLSFINNVYPDITNTSVRIAFYDSDKNFIDSSWRERSNITATFSEFFPKPSNGAFFCYNGRVTNGSVMVSEGSTALPYQPYFLTFPSHQKTLTGWKDIPTHTMTATGWQGELTSQSPLEFKATGQSLLDWRVDGKTSGNLFDVITFNQYAIHNRCTSTTDGHNLTIIATESGDCFLNPTINVGTAIYNDTRRNTLIPCKPNTTYTLYRENAERIYTYWASVDSSYTVTKSSAVSDPLTTFTTDADAKYIYMRLGNAGTLPLDTSVTLRNIRLMEGTYTTQTIPPYEPYGGVGDWDETEQKYVIPVTVGGVTTNLYTDHQLMDGDSLDFATDQTTIPITQGDNTLTVDTAVQPSKVFVKFEG